MSDNVPTPKAIDPGILALLLQLEQVFGTVGLQLLLAWLASLTKSVGGVQAVIKAMSEYKN